MEREAWADESFLEQREAGTEAGVYVIAAAVFEASLREEIRGELRGLTKGLRVGKAHWTRMNDRQRRDAAELVAALDGLHLVTVGAPVPRRRQERARAMCLTPLVRELHDYGVLCLHMEAREDSLNKRDVATVTGARLRLPEGARFRVDHVPGAADPLLWAADIVAGACRADRQGDPQYRDILSERIYDITIDTRC